MEIFDNIQPQDVVWNHSMTDLSIKGVFEIEGQMYECEIPAVVVMFSKDITAEKLKAIKNAKPIWDDAQPFPNYTQTQTTGTTPIYIYSSNTNGVYDAQPGTVNYYSSMTSLLGS